MGAVCKICGKDMMKAKGCTIPKLHANGRVYERIKVGAPGGIDEGMRLGATIVMRSSASSP